MQAQTRTSGTLAGRQQAAEDHLWRMNRVRERIMELNRSGSIFRGLLPMAEFYLAEAELKVAGLKKKPPEREVRAEIQRQVGAADRLYNIYREMALSLTPTPTIYGGIQGALEWSQLKARSDIVLNPTGFARLRVAEEYLSRVAGLKTIVASEDSSRAELTFYLEDANAMVSQWTTPSSIGQMKRFRHGRLKAARETYVNQLSEFKSRRGSKESLHQWSLAWRRSAIEVATRKEEIARANAGHVDRMTELRKVIMDNSPSDNDIAAGRFYESESRVLIGEEYP